MLSFISLLLLAAAPVPVIAARALALPDSSVVTVLRGHLDHAPAGDTVRLWYGNQHVQTPLLATSDFTLVVPGLRGPSAASLSYARQRTPLYLRPGDDLQLTLDFAHFDRSVSYRGRGAAANNYLAQALWRSQGDPAHPSPEQQRTPATTPAQMRTLADAFRRQQHAFLARYATDHPLPPAFQRQAALDVDVEWARLLLDYPGYHRQAAKQAAVLPPDYYAFLRQLPRQQLDEQAMREPVLRMLSAYGGRLLPDGPLRADPAEADRLYALATADWGAHQARDLAMYQMLSFQLPANAAAVVAAYPTFKAQNQDSTLGRYLRLQLRQAQAQPPLQVGQLARRLPCWTTRATPSRSRIFTEKSSTSTFGGLGARPAGRSCPPAPNWRAGSPGARWCLCPSRSTTLSRTGSTCWPPNTSRRWAKCSCAVPTSRCPPPTRSRRFRRTC